MERKGVFFSTEVCNVSLLYVDMWRRFWECQVCTYCMVPFLHCMIKNKFLSLVAWLSELIFSCRTNLPQPGNEIMKHFIIKDILITGVLFTVQKKKQKMAFSVATSSLRSPLFPLWRWRSPGFWPWLVSAAPPWFSPLRPPEEKTNTHIRGEPIYRTFHSQRHHRKISLVNSDGRELTTRIKQKVYVFIVDFIVFVYYWHWLITR